MRTQVSRLRTKQPTARKKGRGAMPSYKESAEQALQSGLETLLSFAEMSGNYFQRGILSSVNYLAYRGEGSSLEVTYRGEDSALEVTTQHS